MSAHQLARYDAARQALAEASRFDDVKDIRDKSLAMQLYAKQAKDGELMAHATEIKMRATRKLDQLRKEQKETVGLNQGNRLVGFSKTRQDDKPTLASQGIDKNLAHQGRVLGALSDEEFEAKVEAAVSKAVAAVERSAMASATQTSKKPKRSDTAEPWAKCVAEVKALISKHAKKMSPQERETLFPELRYAIDELDEEFESQS